MEDLINNLIKATGWSILHSLWQGAIIYALLFATMMALPKMNAKVKHNLAFVSLLLMFLSFCITFFWVFEIPLSNNNRIELNQIAYLDLVKLGSDFNFKTEAYFPVLVSIYTVGIAFQFIFLLTGYLKLKQLKKVNTLAVPALWRSVFELAIAKLKINKTVRFYLSSKVSVPLVIGFFKPVILFPIALTTQLDLEQVEAILIHELSHIRRNDYVINLIKTCIETLLFFNPFVWLTTKFIHIEREHACDDLVLGLTATPLAYAHALLKLEQSKDNQSASLAMAATGTNQHLFQRIKRITSMKTNYMNAKQKLFVITLIITTIVSVAWINPNKNVDQLKNALHISGAKPVTEEKITSLNEVKVAIDSPKKKQFKLTIKGNDGKTLVYHSMAEIPDSMKNQLTDIKHIGDQEWSNHIASLQLSKTELADKFKTVSFPAQLIADKNIKLVIDTPKNKRKKLNMMIRDKDGKQIVYFDELPDSLRKRLADLGGTFDKDWKEKIYKMYPNANLTVFNNKDWLTKFATDQTKFDKLLHQYYSKDWGEKWQSEWKTKLEKIPNGDTELLKKFGLEDGKKRTEEMKKLQESKEYKELREKYERDLEELKRAKGIKST